MLLKAAATASAYAAIGAMVALAWFVHEQRVLSSGTGLGYALGLIGSILMLLLLLYPLRKRVAWLRGLGPVRYWFRAHMILGVLGPALVVVHSNYSLGSLNSRVALFSTLTVAGSGLIGRFIYRRIHHGLYGRRATLDEFRSRLLQNQDQTAGSFPDIDAELTEFENRFIQMRESRFGVLAAGMAAPVATRWRALRARREIERALDVAFADGDIDTDQQRAIRQMAAKAVAARMHHLRRFAQFSLFERLFSLWHVVHYPLFLVMVIAAIVHVAAVHAY